MGKINGENLWGKFMGKINGENLWGNGYLLRSGLNLARPNWLSARFFVV